MKRLLHSRKFWIAIVDAAVGLVALWVGALLIPEQATLVIATFALIQVPVGVLINASAIEDAAALRAGTHPIQE